MWSGIKNELHLTFASNVFYHEKPYAQWNWCVYIVKAINLSCHIRKYGKSVCVLNAYNIFKELCFELYEAKSTSFFCWLKLFSVGMLKYRGPNFHFKMLCCFGLLHDNIMHDYMALNKSLFVSIYDTLIISLIFNSLLTYLFTFFFLHLFP